MKFKSTEFILYVADQSKSRDFYSLMLGLEPALDVPGMTEFILGDNCKLGLMPNSGIAKILVPIMPHPQNGTGIPRCELYLYVDDMNEAFSNGLAAGARLISGPQARDWGDTVCYFADPDGHVIAFAKKTE